MPAYELNWWYSLYFITYIIINTYIFMYVFLAVIYNNYRKHLKVTRLSWGSSGGLAPGRGGSKEAREHLKVTRLSGGSSGDPAPGWVGAGRLACALAKCLNMLIFLSL